MEWIIVVIIVVLAVIPWRRINLTKDYNKTNHPDACFDCNRGGCEGCLLEGLTAEQAKEQMTELTQQAIADSTVPYKRRFERR